MALVSRTDCGSDPSWQATAAAYNGANSDSLLAQWWGKQPQGSFANTLAKSFGAEPTNFECGIGDESSCSIAGCQRMYSNHFPNYGEQSNILKPSKQQMTQFGHI
jgi:hypothetical protein